MTCGCIKEYQCSRCKECYYHTHKVVKIKDPRIAYGWRCPDGFVKPAFPEKT